MLFPLQTPLPTLDFTERWSVSIGEKGWQNGFQSTAALGRKIYYTEQHGDDHGFYGCLDAATGKRLWRRPFDAHYYALIRSSGRYVAVTSEHRLLVLDARTDMPVWQSACAGYGSGPMIVNGRMFATLTKDALTAIDLTTKRVLWRKAMRAAPDRTSAFIQLQAIGTALWFTDTQQNLYSIAQSDGRTLWIRHFSDEDVEGFVPSGKTVTVSGRHAVEGWRPEDARVLWRETTVADAGRPLYRPLTDQVWLFPDYNRLYRFDARTGKRLGDAPTRAKPSHESSQPLAFEKGVLILGQDVIEVLDSQARRTSQFEFYEGVHELQPLGDDLLLDTGDRLVRLHPGAPAPPTNPAALAESLARKPKLSPEDKRTILRLGRAALPALFAHTRWAGGTQAEALADLLRHIADRRDTAPMLDVAERWGVFSGYGTVTRILGDWLTTQADPNVVAERLLPRLKAAHDAETQSILIGYSLRSTAAPVVDELLARLLNPKTSNDVKSVLYGGIAASGRPDVLEAILRIRSEGRRLATPIPELTITRDYDKDGIPDDLDANPFVAPRSLDDTESVLSALFDARFRFAERNDVPASVDYGRGVAPFELVGWKGGLIPADLVEALGKNSPFAGHPGSGAGIRFEPQDSSRAVVVFNADRTEATASVGVIYGPLDGTGYEATLRKMRGEWFVVALRMTWIS